MTTDEREAREAAYQAAAQIAYKFGWPTPLDSAVYAAVDAYKAHLAGKVQDGWQPIETAPKDGERIIAFRQGYVFIASWSDQFAPTHFTNTFDWYDESMGRRDSLVTHWMPLPAAPRPAHPHPPVHREGMMGLVPPRPH